MGSPAERLEKKNILLKKGDEIRRLDGTGIFSMLFLPFIITFFPLAIAAFPLNFL
jgi:hypothetical protein